MGGRVAGRLDRHEPLSRERKGVLMPYFNDIQTFYDALIELFAKLMKDPVVKNKALSSKLKVCFNFYNPDGQMWIDCTGDDVKLLPGSQDISPDATLSMDADVAHRFWLGQLNLIKALSSKDIKSSGSIPKLLKLLPVIKPAFKIYPEVLEENGLGDLVNV